MTQPTPLPYGLRDVKLVPNTDLAATVLGASKIDLPVAQTFSFTDTEDYTDLRGDDKLITSHGQGSSVDWSLEAGGIALEAYAAMAGGTVNETGVTPNRVKRYTATTSKRPCVASRINRSNSGRRTPSRPLTSRSVYHSTTSAWRYAAHASIRSLCNSGDKNESPPRAPTCDTRTYPAARRGGEGATGEPYQTDT